MPAFTVAHADGCGQAWSPDLAASTSGVHGCRFGDETIVRDNVGAGAHADAALGRLGRAPG